MSPRRTALQLTPLLDLLLIVIFAQYLDVGERDRKRIAASESLVERTELAEKESANARAQLTEYERRAQAALDELRVVELQNVAIQRDLALARNALQASRQTERALADTAASLFKIDPRRLEEILAPTGTAGVSTTAAQRDEIRRRLEEVTSGDADAVVFHLMTHEELRKRVDLWRLHLDSNGIATLEAGGLKHSFRIEPASLLRDVGRYADTLPEPKRLVVVLFTYDQNARLITIEAVQDRLPRLMERLSQNSDSRFDYADLGFGSNVDREVE